MNTHDSADIHALSGAYALDAVDDIERAEFERHLAACPPCQAYLDTYDKTVELAKQSGGDDPVPAEVPESLIAAILAARTSGKMS